MDTSKKIISQKSQYFDRLFALCWLEGEILENMQNNTDYFFEHISTLFRYFYELRQSKKSYNSSMHVTKSSLNHLHSITKAVVTTIAIGGLCSGVFAQGVFEGSGEDSSETPSCVGDGCGIEIPTQDNESQAVQPADSAAILSENNGEGTDIDTPAESTEPPSADSVKTVELFDDEDSKATFVSESNDDYRARKEGFSKSIQFGFRAGAGISLNLLGSHTDGWNVGLDLEGGAIAKLPLSHFISVAAGLDFSYRTYSYEADTDYGHNEASISEMLFEIPVFAQYNFDQGGFFVGLGANIGLKMQGETEFKQTIDTKNKHYKDKRHNTMPTTGVELGGLMDIGYVVSKSIIIDLRLVQNVTNLLNSEVLAESSLLKTKLRTSHATLGVTFLL